LRGSGEGWGGGVSSRDGGRERGEGMGRKSR